MNGLKATETGCHHQPLKLCAYVKAVCCIFDYEEYIFEMFMFHMVCKSPVAAGSMGYAMWRHLASKLND